MKTKLPIVSQLMMFLLLVLFTSGCGIRYMVSGKVVDAETGKPIQGATVAIKWYDFEMMALLVPYSSGYSEIEAVSSVTDADGIFKIPKRTFKKYYLGVHKKGYVCWNSEDIFHPEFSGKPDKADKVTETRIGSWVIPGMVIRLEPLKEGYSAEEYAEYVNSVGIRAGDLGDETEEALLPVRRRQQKRGEEWDRQIEEMRRQDKLKKEQGGLQ